MDLLKNIKETYKYINSKTKYFPKIGIILGTGFEKIASKIEDAEYFKYSDIPNFLIPTAKGHTGDLIIGKLGEKEVILLKGRSHYYEGHSMQQITLPVRVLKLLGVETLIVTNCSGQANESIEAGDLVLIKNHLNFTWKNPLVGKNLEEFGEQFIDLSYPYDRDLIAKVKEVANELDINIKEGVYAMFSGPSCETAVETLMAARLGADIIGMSTVPEVIVANHCQMKVVGISGMPCLAAAYSNAEITYESLIDNFENIDNNFTDIVTEFVKRI